MLFCLLCLRGGYSVLLFLPVPSFLAVCLHVAAAAACLFYWFDWTILTVILIHLYCRASGVPGAGAVRYPVLLGVRLAVLPIGLRL